MPHSTAVEQRGSIATSFATVVFVCVSIIVGSLVPKRWCPGTVHADVDPKLSHVPGRVDIPVVCNLAFGAPAHAVDSLLVPILSIIPRAHLYMLFWGKLDLVGFEGAD